MPKKEEGKEEETTKEDKKARDEQEEESPSRPQLDRDQLEALRERLQKKYH
jgi:hypothetical protein